MKEPAAKKLESVREKAEKAIRDRASRVHKLPRRDVEYLVHELGVHQVELESQNEELRRTQEQLEQSRQRYAELYEFAPAGYFTLLKNGVIIGANVTGARQLGIPKESLLNRPFILFIQNAEDRQRFLDLLMEVVTHSSGAAEVLKLQRKDKSAFQARLQIVAARQPAAAGECCLVLVSDVTEQERLEQALRQSEERYKLLFDKSPLPKWVFDLDTWRFLEVNDAAVQHYGYSRGEFRQLTVEDIRTPEEFSKIEQWFAACCRQGQKFEGTARTRHRSKKGDVIDVDVRYTEIEYAGRRAGLAVVIDVTDRKRAEQELKESEDRFRMLSEAAFEGIGITDQGMIREVNRTMMKMTGYSYEELLAMHGWDLMLPEYHDQVRAHVLTGSEEPYEVMVRRKDGTTFPAQAQGRPLIYKGRPARVGAIIDITRRKEVEHERERLIAELRRSNSELQQFAYVASHDLQEPLRTVASYVELLSMKYRGRIDETADRYIAYAVEGAARMSALINDLLAFSRVGTRGSEFAAVHLQTVYRQAVAGLSKAIRENRAEITSDELPVVRGDESQLRQLFQNLLANAIKFRKPDIPPRIEVSAQGKGGYWEFSVKDNGIGIEPRFFERIFVIFQRLHTKEEYPGTGVGLSICRRIVERHGGRIWVESTPGEGSTFYFTLKAA